MFRFLKKLIEPRELVGQKLKRCRDRTTKRDINGTTSFSLNWFDCSKKYLDTERANKAYVEKARLVKFANESQVVAIKKSS